MKAGGGLHNCLERPG